MRVEIWRTPDYEDWAKVNIDKETGHVTDIQASDWDWCGDMSREDAMRMCAEYGGYTVLDPDDIYDSYEEWDECVSI